MLDARGRSPFEAAFQMNMIRSEKKPEKCPQCRSWPLAEILYGNPPNEVWVSLRDVHF